MRQSNRTSLNQAPPALARLVHRLGRRADAGRSHSVVAPGAMVVTDTSPSARANAATSPVAQWRRVVGAVPSNDGLPQAHTWRTARHQTRCVATFHGVTLVTLICAEKHIITDHPCLKSVGLGTYLRSDLANLSDRKRSEEGVALRACSKRWLGIAMSEVVLHLAQIDAGIREVVPAGRRTARDKAVPPNAHRQAAGLFLSVRGQPARPPFRC
jgi:hypothetical protein